MNDIFMNSRGLGDLAKHLNIAQYVRDHKLDFLGYFGNREEGFSSKCSRSPFWRHGFYLALYPSSWQIWRHSAWCTFRIHGSPSLYEWGISYKISHSQQS